MRSKICGGLWMVPRFTFFGFTWRFFLLCKLFKLLFHHIQRKNQEPFSFIWSKRKMKIIPDEKLVYLRVNPNPRPQLQNTAI